MTQPSNEQKLWTPANIVTLVRICLVPLFVIVILSPWPDYLSFWEGANLAKPWIAAFVFILLAATDGLDGYLARSRDEVTNFGKLIDPLADKILVAAALLALIELNVLPSWPALIILTREFIVSGVRMLAASEGRVIAASWYGKAKTVTQIIAIVLFIIKDSAVVEPLTSPLYWVSWLFMVVALVLTIVSMLDYIVKARDVLGFTSSAQEPEGERTAELSPEQRADIEPASIDALATSTLAAARRNGKTLGTAESLTGGLIASTLTGIAGSSDVVRGGIVSYATDVKTGVLGVDGRVVEEHGVVSEETARLMAEGARASLECDLAVAVTGIAGPTGAEPDKPVGTVWIAVADAAGTSAECRHFPGTRTEVRLQTVHAALTMVLRRLDRQA